MGLVIEQLSTDGRRDERSKHSNTSTTVDLVIWYYRLLWRDGALCYSIIIIIYHYHVIACTSVDVRSLYRKT